MISRIRIWGFDCLNHDSQDFGVSSVERLKDYRDFHNQRNQRLILVIIKS